MAKKSKAKNNNQEKNLGGRPPEWELTAELAETICELVSINTCSLEEICKNNYPKIPGSGLIKRWRIKHDWFGSMYARAKQIQVEFHMENATDHAYELVKDSKEQAHYFSMEHIMAVRALIDTIKFLAIKLAPKIYGDKQQESDNDNSHPTMVVNFLPSSHKPKSEE